MVARSWDRLGQMEFREVQRDGGHGIRVGVVPFLQMPNREARVLVAPLPIRAGDGRAWQPIPRFGELRGAGREIFAQFSQILLQQPNFFLQRLIHLFQLLAAFGQPAIKTITEQLPRAGDFEDQADNLQHLAAERQMQPVID